MSKSDPQQRQFSGLDHLVSQLDTALRTLSGNVITTQRENPSLSAASDPEDAHFDESARLMRINHAGEVAAQGLYQGQALTASLSKVRQQMEQAALEENDHLDWCRQRAEQLGSHTSYLDPVWYLGSVAIGAAAGLAGDKWSLGFVAETERQVVKHLEDHLRRLPTEDEKSRAILEQMKHDEGEHATSAIKAGAADLPQPVKQAMSLVSKIMTKTAYWV